MKAERKMRKESKTITVSTSGDYLATERSHTY